MEVKTAWQDILNRHPPVTHEMMLTDPFYAQAVDAVVIAIVDLQQQLMQYNPEYVGLGRDYLTEKSSFIWLCHYRMLLSELVVDAVAKSTIPARIIDNPADWFCNTPISSLFKESPK